MNRDDVIRMAREAGSIDSEDVIETVYAAFAAAEREACAKLCDDEERRKADEGTWLWEAARCAKAIRARGQA